MLIGVAIFGVWLAVQMKWIHDRHEVLRWAEGHTGFTIVPHLIPRDAPWSIRILGEPAGSPMMGITVSTPDERRMAMELKRLFPERFVAITDSDELHFSEHPTATRPPPQPPIGP